MLKAVVFDLDGTLLDTIPDIAAALNHSLAANGLPTHPAKAVEGFVGGGIRSAVVKAAPAGSSEAVIEQVLAGYHDVYVAHCTDRTARNNAGTFRSRKQQYQPFAKFPFDLVRNAGTYDRYANEVALCILGAFADRFRDLSCFAAANADQTVFVADDDQSGKAEVTSALYYFGYAVYGNKFFFQF